jgi:hypothetical protein
VIFMVRAVLLQESYSTEFQGGAERREDLRPVRGLAC